MARLRNLRGSGARNPAPPLPTTDPLRWEAAVPGSILFHGAHVTCESDALIVGDSHVLICGAHEAFPDCDVDALPGRNSAAALEIFDRYVRPRHRVVVFEISTNDIIDPATFDANLELLLERLGERELILVNCWRTDGVNTHLEVNAVLAEFVDRHPRGTTLVDWAAYVDAHTAPLDPDTDRVHFSVDAYLGRIELVTAAIEAARNRARKDG